MKMTEEKDNDKKKIIEEVGNLPVNSRIYINYKETPPKITFEYPDKNINQIRNSTSTVLISLVISLIMIGILVIIWFYFLNNVFFKDVHTIQIDDAKIVSYNFSGFETFKEIEVNYTWNNKPGSTTIGYLKGGTFWYYPKFETHSKDTRRNLLADLIPVLIFYFVFFALLFLNMRWITKVFANTKWGHKHFPQIGRAHV